MTLLFRIIYAAHANGTHHKLALDALRHLQGPQAEAWRNLFLAHADTYLEGSKAPDKQFKDFTNHVLHVRDGYWGGAANKAMNWYAHVVEALKANNWQDAVYAAGVLSHYYTDPIMPFHTAQSEAENNIHRAAEWSISKSYDDLNRLAKASFPVPDVPIEDREDWLADLVCDAAEISNGFYEKLIANYDLDKGVVDPPSGLNERAQRIVAQLIAYAQVGQARILERAFAEAGVAPPPVNLTPASVLAGLKIPIRWVLKKMSDAQDRRLVQAMYDEMQATGTVEKTLPEDDRLVRDRFKAEVGTKSADPRPVFRPPHRDGAFDYAGALSKRHKVSAGEDEKPASKDRQKHVEPATAAESATSDASTETDETDAGSTSEAAAMLQARAEEMAVKDKGGPHDQTAEASNSPRTERQPEFRLKFGDEVEEGPSVGPKTALRLNTIGIVTVADLLSADPKETASSLNVSYVNAQTVTDWQDQACMQCEVPGLSGTGAQLIVGAGYRRGKDLASADIDKLHGAIAKFAASSAGERILRDRPAPGRDQVANWIKNAGLGKARDAA